MALADEKQGFSKRLREGLRHAGVREKGAASIAREFNLRYHGTPITAQAVRKWLAGRSLPAQDKIRALALWLEVSPHWLRFGEPEGKLSRTHSALRQDAATYRLDPAWLSTKFDALNEAHQKMVAEVVIALLRLEGKR